MGAKTTHGKYKTDYFVEEIRANIIYENKIAPIIGMLAGGVARAVGGVGKKVVQVRKGKGFYTKTIDHIFGDKPKFIKSFLRIDKVGTTVNIDSRAGKLLRSYFPRPKD